MERKDKVNYYLDIAQTVSERGTCLRRNYGAVIVKNDAIISTGYNGAPRGRKNCCDMNFCMRDHLSIPRGERYEMCRSVHSEQNAIINAPRDQMIGAEMFMCCTDPQTKEIISNINCCMMCKRMIINAGIERVYFRDSKDDWSMANVSEWIENDDSLTGKFGY